MRGALRRLATVASAGMLATGLAAGATALGATPAFASTACGDGTTASAPAYTGPSSQYPTGETLGSGVQVYGNCDYFNNIDEGHWYMAINWTEGRTLYVWVQKLAFGSVHECLKNGQVYGIGSSQCPLFNAHNP